MDFRHGSNEKFHFRCRTIIQTDYIVFVVSQRYLAGGCSAKSQPVAAGIFGDSAILADSSPGLIDVGFPDYDVFDGPEELALLEV